jgi:hypothetical protein
LPHVVADAGGACGARAVPRHEDDVDANEIAPLVTQRFPQPTPDAVPDDGIADLPAHGPTEARRRIDARPHVPNEQEAEGEPPRAAMNGVVIDLADEPHRARPSEPATGRPPGRPTTLGVGADRAAGQRIRASCCSR